MGRRTFLGAVGAGIAIAGVAGTAGGTHASDDDRDRPAGVPATLPSAISVDSENLEATLPLYRGRGPDGGDVYYVLTEASHIEYANRFGLNWAPKLKNALGTAAVQTIQMADSDQFNLRDSSVQFAGTVDFSPDRTVEPGPDGFPPATAEPGSVGDAAYSPFVATRNQQVVFNAPHVANDSGEHDHLVKMDTGAMTATLELVEGFYEDRDVLYLTTDAYPADVAAIEGGTFVANLSEAPATGDRSLETSAREAIFPVVNGPDGQGLQSALLGNGGPRNVTRSEQVCRDPRDPTDCSLFYSPLWDVHPVAWTQAAIDAGERRFLTDHEEIIDLVVEGEFLVSVAADGPVNTLLGNIRALDAAVNCPIVSVAEEAGTDGDGDDGSGGEDRTDGDGDDGSGGEDRTDGDDQTAGDGDDESGS